jgi:glycosyltransferase involved in cell wall biosynthesis
VKISAVIIVKNAEQTIAATLESLKAFDEVLIYDNGSMDKTLPIAGKYENVKIVMGLFIGFGETKNAAASYARNDWIFSIDSDEVVSPFLLNSISETKLQTDIVYGFERFNYYRKKRVRFSGWRKETIYRLYHKGTTKFNNKKVHEGLILDNIKTSFLKGELKHYSYQKISDFNRKRALYSDLFAGENKGKRKSSPLRAVISGMYDFFNTYFLRLGFLDGYRGLLISFSNSSVTFIKYLKLYEANLNNNIKTSLIVTTYNRPTALKKTLESILEQTVPPEEIIIADDGSTDTTRIFIKEFSKTCFIPIHHIWQSDKGFRAARSRNKAIVKAQYEYLIFIDGDMILHKKFIENHLSEAKQGIFIQGSRVLLSPDQTEKILKSDTKNFNLLFSESKNKLNSLYCNILSKLFWSLSSNSHNGIRSCNFSLYKQEIIKVNGFNEDFVGWGREDSELVERLFNTGIKRKNLKFKGIQYHLYHTVGVTKTENNQILEKSVSEKLNWCPNGINKYLQQQK